jgi:hypothetical protein
MHRQRRVRHRRLRAVDHAAISKTEFDQYFQNSTRSSALWLADPVSFVDPMPLEYLRAIADFRPPQSYRYLTSDAARRLIDLDDTALRRLGLDDQPAQEADRPVVRSSHDMKIRWMRRVFGWLTHRDRRSPV